MTIVKATAVFACLLLLAAAEPEEETAVQAALSGDDECLGAGSENCALEALQRAMNLSLAEKKQSSIKVINACNKPIWMAHCCNYRYRQNVRINPWQSHTFPAYAGLTGFRMWPKSGCDRNGNGCLIGQSGGPGQPCGAGGYWKCVPHIDTKFEGTFGRRHDYFDMSLVDGYTFPFKLRLRGCRAKRMGSFMDCSGLTLGACPRGNKEFWNYGGKRRRTQIGCHARGKPGHGNRGYVAAAHRLCRESYAYDLDDKTGNKNCPAGTQYEITFQCLH